MAKTGQTGLEGIVASLPREKRGSPPVHLWNPPFCGDIDMQIDGDGTWFYQKTPIGRPALVRLFARCSSARPTNISWLPLWRKSASPSTMRRSSPSSSRSRTTNGGQVLNFRTNVDDWVAAGPGHALRFERQADNGGLKPYLHVRRDLWAKVTRALFYDLVELGEEREVGGKEMFGVSSGGEFYAMAEASALREFA